MSGDEDEVKLLELHEETEQSTVSTKTKSKPRLTEAQKLRQDAINFVNIDPLVYPNPISRKHHVSKKSLACPSQDDTSMSETGIVDQELLKEIEEDRLNDLEWQLIPFAPGQTDGIKRYPTRLTFTYAYEHFYDPKCRRYLTEVQEWLKFLRKYHKEDISIPVWDCTGKEYPQLINWSLQDIDSLPANVDKLIALQDKQKQQPKSVPQSSQIQVQQHAQSTSSKSHSKEKTTVSDLLRTTVTSHSSDNPGKPPSRDQSPEDSNSVHSSPDRMPSLRDRAVFFPQSTFDGKDKTKTRTHLQSFEDFVDRQKLDKDNEFDEIKEYFLMTLRDLARQWFNSSTFDNYADMKTKFKQEFSEYGKTPREWLKAWTELKFKPDSDNLDEYIQKFEELAILLNYPQDHQVQIFKMMMPENIELRIKDMTTLKECLEETKSCISICQPSSLVSRMSTLTISPTANSPIRSRSPSPQRRQRPNNSGNRTGRVTQRPILRRPSFQGFRQYPGNFQPRSSSGNRQNFRTNQRFRSFSRSQSRGRPQNYSNPIICFYCQKPGHTANNCFRRQNRQNYRDRPNQRPRQNFYNNNRRQNNGRPFQPTNRNYRQPQAPRVSFTETPMYSDLQMGDH